MSVTDESTDAVKEALVSLAQTARRCPAIITAWDRRHEDIDALLERLV